MTQGKGKTFTWGKPDQFLDCRLTTNKDATDAEL